MRVQTYITMRWHSTSLRWDASAYGNRNRLVVASERIWMPPLQPYNHNIATRDKDFCQSTACEVTDDGQITCYLPCVQEFSCVSRLNDWPYDRLRCEMMIGIDTMLTNDFPLRLRLQQAIDVEQRSTPTGYWHLEEWSSHSVNSTSMEFEMQLERQTIQQRLIFSTPVTGKWHPVWFARCAHIKTHTHTHIRSHRRQQRSGRDAGAKFLGASDDD